MLIALDLLIQIILTCPKPKLKSQIKVDKSKKTKELFLFLAVKTEI